MTEITKTPQSLAFELIKKQIYDKLGINIFAGPLPKDGGVTAEINNGINKGRYLNKQHGKEQLTVLFLCKNASQNIAYDTLNAIGNMLNTLEPIGTGALYVPSVEVKSGAGLVGNDGGYCIFSMIVGINIIF